MSRIAATFEALRKEKRSALIPFVTAGDPSPAQMPAIMDALVAGGADVIELGVPFSDPMADGPAIQRSSERALKHGVGLKDILGMVATFRKRNDKTPIVLMGYANPIEHMGYAAFVSEAKKAGVDGVLVVDSPPDESAEYLKALEGSGIDPIFLLAPTSTPKRVESVAKIASGYIYYVSLKGVSGASHIDTTDVEAAIARIRKQTKIPVGVGFGIRDAATATRVAGFADAVVVGSRLVDEIANAPADAIAPRLQALVREFRAALDNLARAA
ncbi:tryptophan synthase subunit alpha [Usitatibacter palustris]|uniref:Tryptophan synthase alpha chain n=1 Tax=Usitatibacter palustris TaxID=2732487 RepID=A0A6M4H4V5_9PROT|nr:tryptophan synthase subunit alpha [Usitatibacter palustris]QJR14679.1 Tryptophan synthase alpha chain [Usitatibacter palustris]